MVIYTTKEIKSGRFYIDDTDEWLFLDNLKVLIKKTRESRKNSSNKYYEVMDKLEELLKT